MDGALNLKGARGWLTPGWKRDEGRLQGCCPRRPHVPMLLCFSGSGYTFLPVSSSWLFGPCF